MTAAYAQIVDELRDLRRQWRAKLLTAGTMLAGAVALAALIVTVAADNVLKLGTGGRFVLALILWGVVGGGLFILVVRRCLENRCDDYFATMVERKHPELRNVLVNALQLGRNNNPGSPRLIDAIVKDAAGATANLELADCLDPRPLKQAALFAGIGLLVLAGYGLVFRAQFANGLKRVLLPAANIAPYSATQIVESSIKPGSTRVPEGATVNIEAQVAGVIPDSAKVWQRVAGKSWRPVSMQSSARETFACSLPQLTESFDYYIGAGDGRSRVYRIDVVKRPQVEKLSVAYTLPPYTGAPGGTNATAELAGLAGTTVALEIVATKPLREATVITAGKQVVPLTKAADERTWRGTFVIWSADAKGGVEIIGQRIVAPSRYSVRLLDTDGYENAEPLWHSITLLRDQPPTVAIVAPGRDLQLRLEETLKLVVDARDDYGVGEVQVLYRVNDEQTPRQLPALDWKLADAKLKPGDLVQYWAVAADRNNITGPGRSESRRYSIYIVEPERSGTKMDLQLGDFAQVLEEILRMQRENRAQTASGLAFAPLVTRQVQVRTLTGKLARAMEQGVLPLQTMVQALDELHVGLMAEAVRLLEQQQREPSLPVQDKIIEQLAVLLARLQKDQQAREALRKLEKSDKAAHGKIAEALTAMVKDLDRMLGEEHDVTGKFEKLPKRSVDEFNKESVGALKELDRLAEKWGEWAKGKVDELAKLPTGFVDDFGLRSDVKRLVEEIEKAAQRPKAVKMEIPVEEIADPLGRDITTRMKEDLETWMLDTPDYQKWVLEEPFKKMNIPEMPLPDALEDLIGDLLQKEDEIDQDAEDVTSAWGMNLDQAGWAVMDGPWSVFSAKGKTGNDMPNAMELTGRSGDGRRGQSSGQMVGDTARGLKGRKTPARVGAEHYEPGNLKVEAQDDPRGATGGGKKAGAGQRGLQGGTPPDFVKDMQRLAEKQVNVREQAEKVAQKLEVAGVSSRRLTEAIALMKSIEGDYRDLRYEDAARKRRVALSKLDAARQESDATGVALSRARDLPAAMRQEVLQATDEGYPPGYEDLLKSYYRALSEGEK